MLTIYDLRMRASRFRNLVNELFVVFKNDVCKLVLARIQLHYSIIKSSNLHYKISVLSSYWNSSFFKQLQPAAWRTSGVTNLTFKVRNLLETTLIPFGKKFQSCRLSRTRWPMLTTIYLYVDTQISKRSIHFISVVTACLIMMVWWWCLMIEKL